MHTEGRLPKWAREPSKGLHWGHPELYFISMMLSFALKSADVSQKGDSRSPAPRGSVNECSLSDPRKGDSLGSGSRVELEFSEGNRQVRICMFLS